MKNKISKIENYIKITFKFEENKSTENADKSTKSADKINKILKYLQENKSATTNELSKLIGVESRRTRVILNEMVNNNLIIKEGANKNRVYKLKLKKE